ncbi:MAG TPA: acyl-ACP thioesterase domain-containing protein [Sunxiuqinia sp.]|nr:acyl-ACP thioesterase domain-containing protein [Sunxiuqinia sp.]
MEKFIQKITIRSYQTDLHAQASITALFNYMLEAAWAHAQEMKWGYDELKNNHLFWVLSRLYLKIEKYPSWQDEITLNTWSSGTDGMYAYREFVLENDNHEVLLRCSTAWLILDLETKRIYKLRKYIDTFPRLKDEEACRKPKRIKPLDHYENLSFSPVRYSELDVNKHFNSVKYLERVIDDFESEFLDRHELASLEVNYLKEGMAGDFLAIDTQKLDDGNCLSTVVRESDGVDLCTMITKWRKRGE